MRYLDARRKLVRLGCVEIPRRGGGAHRKWHNPATDQTTVVPDHGTTDLRIGTLRAVVRQLGLDWSAFEQA